MTDTVTRLMELADKAIDAQALGLGCFAQDYRQALQYELQKLLDPVVEPVATQRLAEMIMSDCGCSTNNQRLVDRIVARIEQYDRANTSPPPPADVPLLTDEEIKSIHTQLCNTVGSYYLSVARAIEQLVRQKAGIK